MKLCRRFYVPAVSSASKGDTSSDTQPSTPLVAVVDRTEEVGGPGQILQRKFEEQLLARFALNRLLADGIVVEARLS